jgi:glycogen phosphorylase
MLSEALPIYSGGLGNMAGDQLKAASDLGIPVIGSRPSCPSTQC